MTLSPTDKVQIKKDDLVWREVGDELVVLELETTTYLTLNGSARTLWMCLLEETTSDHMIVQLVDEYGITRNQAQSDVNSFLSALEARNLLVLPGGISGIN